MEDRILVNFVLNQKPISISVEPGTSLLDTLRLQLGLTGTKHSCDNEGVCGACTVIIDGIAKQSCLVPIEEVAGHTIETIEGVGSKGELHPLQKVFVLDRVMQCGYATPGQLMTSKALLDSNSNPSHAEVALALDKNISRCSAGYRAVGAVLKAAAVIRGEDALDWDSEDEAENHYAVTKVTGELKYTDDLSFPEMLFGRVKRSTIPHARIDSVNFDAALQKSGVKAVFTAKDVPGKNRVGLIRKDQPVFADKVVLRVGDAIALVVADSPSQAEAALDSIFVKYTPLPVITNPREALSSDAPLLHEPFHEGQHANLLDHTSIRKGDVTTGFKESDLVIEDDYFTPYQEHAYDELECSIALYENDEITIYTGSQGPSFDQDQISEVLGIPKEKIRIACMPVGGGFGGKEDLHTQAFAALATYHLQVPVKVQFSREESLIASHKRHPMDIHYKTGVTKDGYLKAVEAEIYGDTGAYASSGIPVLFRAATFAGGPYTIPHAKVDSYAVYTNNAICGAFRGFGSPQAHFAAEVQIEKAARALGIDPIEFRLKNALKIGSMTITGSTLREDIGDGIYQCLEAVRDALKKTTIPLPKEGEKIGIGVAGCYKNIGLGSGIPDGAKARIKLEEDGSFLLRVGAIDLGQGSTETLIKLAALTLGVKSSRISIHWGDTRFDPYGGMTTASRVTYVSGNATVLACETLLQKIKVTIASEFGIEPDIISLSDDCVIRSDTGESLLPLRELAKLSNEPLLADVVYDPPITNTPPAWISSTPTMDEINKYQLHFAYSFGAQAAIVAVHEQSGEIKVHHIIGAFDCGNAINRLGVLGQIEGGLIQGLGFSLTEKFSMQDGFHQVTTLGELGLPLTSTLPTIESIIIENYHPTGPLGAKGMGEMPLTAAAPAIVNAIYDAVGIWINKLPVTPEKIRAAIAEKRII